MYFNQDGSISSLNGKPLILVNQFTSLVSSILSTANDVNICISKPWTAINRLRIILKSDLSDKIRRGFWQAVALSILSFGCTIWTSNKKVGRNYTRMLSDVWPNAVSSTIQKSICWTIYLPSHKPSLKYDQYVLGASGEERTELCSLTSKNLHSSAHMDTGCR